MPQAYKSVIRVARKQHTCCECKQVIAKNERYQLVSGIWDDRPDSFKTCFRCVGAIGLAKKTFPPAYPEEGPPHGQLFDWLQDEMRFYTSDYEQLLAELSREKTE